MKLLKEYFEIQQKIYDYFGYVEDWVVIPIEDKTEYYWCVQGTDKSGDVVYAKDVKDFATGDYYSNELYQQRFLPRCVYRGEDYTMICVDTHTDGNKFLQIFDNKKEIDNLE